jgi:hypothetical protein
MHPPPLSGFRRLSWGCAALQGHKRSHLGRVLVAPNPYGVFTPSGYSASAPSPSRSCGRPFMDFRSSSELDHRDPAPSRRANPACQTTLPLLDFLRPTTQCQAGGYAFRQQIPPPPRATCGVWLPPSRRTPPVLPMRQAHRSILGLLPSRVSPRHDRCPSRSPCLPAVTAPRLRLPGGRRTRRWPTSRPSSRNESVLTPEPQVAPAVDPFLRFTPPERSPARPGARFDRGTSPLVLRRLDV